MADELKFPAKRGRPPILVWDGKNVGAPVHDARGHALLGDRVPEGHARRGSLCSLYVRGQKQQYNYRLCRPCGGAMGHLFGT
jgi:hypothetical protein